MCPGFPPRRLHASGWWATRGVAGEGEAVPRPYVSPSVIHANALVHGFMCPGFPPRRLHASGWWATRGVAGEGEAVPRPYVSPSVIHANALVHGFMCPGFPPRRLHASGWWATRGVAGEGEAVPRPYVSGYSAGLAATRRNLSVLPRILASNTKSVRSSSGRRKVSCAATMSSPAASMTVRA